MIIEKRVDRVIREIEEEARSEVKVERRLSVRDSIRFPGYSVGLFGLAAIIGAN